MFINTVSLLPDYICTRSLVYWFSDRFLGSFLSPAEPQTSAAELTRTFQSAVSFTHSSANAEQTAATDDRNTQLRVIVCSAVKLFLKFPKIRAVCARAPPGGRSLKIWIFLLPLTFSHFSSHKRVYCMKVKTVENKSGAVSRPHSEMEEERVEGPSFV